MVDNHEAAPQTLTPCWRWWRSCPCFGDGDQRHKKKRPYHITLSMHVMFIPFYASYFA